jgi:hypothetical protein
METIVFDPKKVAIPVGMVMVIILGIIGWYKAYIGENTSSALAVALIQQKNIDQDEDTERNEDEITKLQNRMGLVENEQRTLSKDIAVRLDRIETALGIKKD